MTDATDLQLYDLNNGDQQFSKLAPLDFPGSHNAPPQFPVCFVDVTPEAMICPTALTISHNCANSLTARGIAEAFFRGVLTPTVKHV